MNIATSGNEGINAKALEVFVNALAVGASAALSRRAGVDAPGASPRSLLGWLLDEEYGGRVGVDYSCFGLQDLHRDRHRSTTRGIRSRLSLSSRAARRRAPRVLAKHPHRTARGSKRAQAEIESLGRQARIALTDAAASRRSGARLWLDEASARSAAWISPSTERRMDGQRPLALDVTEEEYDQD